MVQLNNLTESQVRIVFFLLGFTGGFVGAWVLRKKVKISGDQLTALQIANILILVCYMLVAREPKETFLIALAGFLFGEPIGRVITGGKDDKKN